MTEKTDTAHKQHSEAEHSKYNEHKHSEHSEHKHSKHNEHKHSLDKHEAHKAKEKSFKNYWLIAVVILGIIAIALLVVNMDKIIPEKVPVQTEMGTLVLTVNGEPVYSKDIEKRLSYYQAQYGPVITEEFVINQTINELLLLGEAKKQGIQIDEKKIDDAVDEWLIQVKQTVPQEQIDEILAKENLTMDELLKDTRDSYKKNFLVYDLLNKSVFSKLDLAQFDDVEVTDAEVLAEYNKNKDMIYNQYNVSHILICYEGTTSCEKNRTKFEADTIISSIYKKLQNNADFYELAKQESDCPSASQGGVLGFLSKSAADKEMDAVFIDETFKLRNKNQYSEPFITQFGYHIVKVSDIMNSFDDFKQQINFQLQYEKQMNAENEKMQLQQEAVEAYLSNLRKNAIIVNHKAELVEGINPDPKIQTFSSTNNEICRVDGKPIIRLYTTTTCPHCVWIGATFDKVVKEYVASGKIVAHHWDLDSKDDLLTSEDEGAVPQSESDVYTKFNPRGSIPTFVFGCVYYRIGNAYEQEKSLAKEEAEFRAVIEKLIA